MQQRDPATLFQFQQSPADGSRGNSKSVRSLRDAAQLHDGEEDAQLLQIELQRMVLHTWSYDLRRFGTGQLDCERFDRSCDVLQLKSAKLGKCKIKPAMHMVAYRPGHAYAARQALGLKSRGHVHSVTVQVGAVRNCVTDVDPDTKSNGLV